MIGGPLRIRFALIPFCFILIILSRALPADPPKLDFIYPAGAERGTTITLTLGGNVEPWPMKVWSDAAGLVFEPTEKKGEVKVQIPKDAPLGPCLIRAFGDEGASAPRCFVIDDLADTAETEPNDDYHSPQKIEKTPVVIHGRLDKSGDADSFAITLAAEQWLVARVEGYGIGSPIDPSLHLRDSAGHRLADAYDTRNLDPLLAFQAPADGSYILQIDAFAHIPRFDVRLFGSPACVYRLSIHTGPYAQYVYPLGITEDSEGLLQLHGWNLPQAEGAPPNVKFAAERLAPTRTKSVTMRPVSESGAENHPAVAISRFVQAVEAESNDVRNMAQKLVHPLGVSGRICPAGDVDWFALEMKKGETASFSLLSASLGFGLDSVMTIADADGQTLASSDDANATWDSELAWAAPNDAAYYVRIADRFGKGADEFVYYLEIAPPTPRVEATAEKATLKLDAGTTSTLKVNVSRLDGYSKPLIATAVDLPEGVVATSPAVPEKGGEVTILLAAAREAKPANGPFRVILLSTDPASPDAVVGGASLDVELPVGPQLIQRTDKLWLTVVPQKAETPSATAETKK